MWLVILFHDFKDAKVKQTHLPKELNDKRYYFPTDRGIEGRIFQKIDGGKEKL